MRFYCIAFLAICCGVSHAVEPDLMIGNFDERTLSGWKTEGPAFQWMPVREREQAQGALGGGFVSSGKDGPSAQGTLLSPEFKIERAFINYLISGARDAPSVLGVELLVDGRVLRAGSASEAKDPARTLYWRTWDVRELAGRTAQIRVNDRSPTTSVAVDQFVQSDEAKGVPADSTRLGHESHRPQFHYTSLKGWLNDANGLLYYKSQWHLFHQHRPAGGTAIMWGHAVSSDLLHWQRLPTAIAPGNLDAAASGSGLVDWDNISGLKRGEDPPILLFHTLMPPAGTERKGTQCLVFSTDGLRTLENFPGNPVLRTPATRDRDPKVFFHKPTRSWIMALSLSRNNADREHATYGLFRSRDLQSWELMQELGPGTWYWECPDMFEMAVDGDPQKMKWVFMKGSGDYLVGTFDGSHFTLEAGPVRAHWGGSFYGAQTFSDAPDGRRVHIGWMSTGKAGPNSWPGMPFNQQMSFPRELTLRSTPEGPRIFREPVAEITKLRARTQDLGARALAPDENALAGIAPGLLEIECEIELQQAKRVSLKCRSAELSYEVKSGKMRCQNASSDVVLKNDRLSWRMLIDRTSIETFVNGGEADLAAVYFADMSDPTLTLSVEGGAAKIHRLVVHELNSVWPETGTKRDD